MTSNAEGKLVDDKKHIYGIVVDTLGFPIVFNLFAEDSQRWSSQLFSRNKTISESK